MIIPIYANIMLKRTYQLKTKKTSKIIEKRDLLLEIVYKSTKFLNGPSEINRYFKALLIKISVFLSTLL